MQRQKGHDLGRGSPVLVTLKWPQRVCRSPEGERKQQRWKGKEWQEEEDFSGYRQQCQHQREKDTNVIDRYLNQYLSGVWESRRAAWHFMFETIGFGNGGEDQPVGLGPTNC